MVGAPAQGRQGGWRTVGSKGEEFGGIDQRGCCERACLELSQWRYAQWRSGRWKKVVCTVWIAA